MNQAIKTATAIERFLCEHSDGFIFIGFCPETQEPMTCAAARDGKTEMALNAVMGAIVNSGGVGALRERLKDAQQGQQNEGEGGD